MAAGKVMQLATEASSTEELRQSCAELAAIFLERFAGTFVAGKTVMQELEHLHAIVSCKRADPDLQKSHDALEQALQSGSSKLRAALDGSPPGREIIKHAASTRAELHACLGDVALLVSSVPNISESLDVAQRCNDVVKRLGLTHAAVVEQLSEAALNACVMQVCSSAVVPWLGEQLSPADLDTEDMKARFEMLESYTRLDFLFGVGGKTELLDTLKEVLVVMQTVRAFYQGDLKDAEAQRLLVCLSCYTDASPPTRPFCMRFSQQASQRRYCPGTRNLSSLTLRRP